MNDQLLDVPPLAGDLLGNCHLSIDSRWRGFGAVIVSPHDSRVLEVLAGWRLLLKSQIVTMASLGQRQQVLDRVFRLGLVDRVTVAGRTAYTLSRYTTKQLGQKHVTWTPLLALRTLAANRIGEILTARSGGTWTLEPDAARTAVWDVAGVRYTVFCYRYWPGCEAEALAVLPTIRHRLMVLVPRQQDAVQLAGAVATGEARSIRWTWDGALRPGQSVQFWAWNGASLVEAEEFAISRA